MDNERKKDYLKGYQRACREIDRIREEIEDLETSTIHPSAITYDGMPKGSTLSDLSDYSVRKEKYLHKLKKAIYKCDQKRKEINDRINGLNNQNERDVLYYRYIKGEKWEDICVRTGYSWQHLHRIHSSALINLRIPER